MKKRSSLFLSFSLFFSLFLSLSSALHACSSLCLYDFDDETLLPNDTNNTNNHRFDDDDDDFDVGVCPSFRDFDHDER